MGEMRYRTITRILDFYGNPFKGELKPGHPISARMVDVTLEVVHDKREDLDELVLVQTIQLTELRTD